MVTEFSWNPVENRHLSLNDIERIWGSQHFQWLCVQPGSARLADCYARGAWDANDKQGFALYTRYAELMDAEG